MKCLSVSLLLLLACSESTPRSWALLADAHDSALLSVWGTDENNVWVVGGRAELDGSPEVLHYVDGIWNREDPNVTGIDLWWVFGFNANDIWVSGSEGAILRWNGNQFTAMETPRSGTIFGLWGAAPDDVWAAGKGSDGKAIVWHWNGTAWSEPALPKGTPSIVFKVHGTASDDVWFAAESGIILHWDGSLLSLEQTAATGPLFSIVASGDSVFAVGDSNGGTILERSGGTWNTVPSPVVEAFRGVAGSPEQVVAVAETAGVAERIDDEWTRLPSGPTLANYHGAWIDPRGGMWIVGGDFDAFPLTREGVITYYGTEHPNSQPNGQVNSQSNGDVQ